jgi:hypothetical protein
MYIIIQGSLGASYKAFVIQNSGILDFWSCLSTLRKFLPIKKEVKLFLVFLMIIIIIAAIYGNEFITSSNPSTAL